jgi:hypothetical protein
MNRWLQQFAATRRVTSPVVESIFTIARFLAVHLPMGRCYHKLSQIFGELFARNRLVNQHKVIQL